MAKTLAAGSRIGDYLIIDRLGAGSMGQVFRARQEALDREIALKVIPGAGDGDSEEGPRFLREGKIQSRLSHPNLVKVHDRGVDGSWMYIAMELVPGRSLGRQLGQEISLDPGRSLEVCLQVARGLAYLHASRTLHRDLKPDNVMIGTGGVVKICDFGLARLDEDTLLTADRRLIGTLSTMAPEIMAGDAGAEPADVYSLGVIFYQMLTGRLPHSSNDSREFLQNVMNKAPLPFPDGTAVPADYQELCYELLRRDPARRPTAATVVARIEQIQAGGREVQHAVRFRVASLFRSLGDPLPARRRRRLPVVRPGRLVLVALVSGLAALGVRRTVTEPTTPFATASPEIPVAELPLGEKLLQEFSAQLMTQPTRIRLGGTGTGTGTLPEWFWHHRTQLDREGREGGISCWFLVLEPDHLDSIMLTIKGVPEGAGGTLELEINGEPVLCSSQGSSWQASIGRDKLGRGVNHAWIRVPPETHLVVTAGCSPSQCVPPARLPAGAIDWGRGVSRLAQLDPAQHKEFFDCWSNLWTALFRDAALCSTELRRQYPGRIEHVWFGALLEVTSARLVRDMELLDATAATPALSQGELRDPETAARDVALAMDGVHRALRASQDPGMMWRVLGEILVTMGEPEMGMTCLEQGCLTEPRDAAVWFGFASVHEFDHAHSPFIAAHRALVKESLQVAASLVAEPQDVMDSRMRKHVMDACLALERGARPR